LPETPAAVAVYEIQTDREAEAFVRSLLRRFALCLATLLGIVLISTAGLVLFSSEHSGTLGQRIYYAFWDTLNLITTVGDIDESLSTGQRAWAILVIIFGLGTVLTAFSTLQGLLLGGAVRRHFARRNMQRTLHDMTGHIILCGFGHVGREVAERIRKASRKLIVIDRDESAVTDADTEGYFVMRGDCTDEHTLREAGLERAAGLIVTLDSDASNVYLILVARELRPDLRIVTRGEKDASRRTLRRAGADRVIVPGESAGAQLSQLILKPRLSEFMASAIDEGEYDFAEIEVAEHEGLQDKALRELDLPRRAQMIVISIITASGEQEFSPGADRVLKADDTLLVVCREGGRERLAALG
jgi:voltage-gated potassium channel